MLPSQYPFLKYSSEILRDSMLQVFVSYIMIQLLKYYYGSNKASLFYHVKIIDIKSPFSLSRSIFTLQLLDDLSKVFASAVLICCFFWLINVLKSSLSSYLNPRGSLLSVVLFSLNLALNLTSLSRFMKLLACL